MTEPATHDARDGSGDPVTDPAAMGEESFAHPDGDGGAVPDQPDRTPDSDGQDRPVP